MNKFFEGVVVQEMGAPPASLSDNPFSTFKVENGLSGFASGGVTAYFHLPQGALRVGDHVRLSLEKIDEEAP